MNLSVAIQDQLKTTEESALISCMLCLYQTATQKLKIELFFLRVLEKYSILGCNIRHFRQI